MIFTSCIYVYKHLSEEWFYYKNLYNQPKMLHYPLGAKPEVYFSLARMQKSNQAQINTSFQTTETETSIKLFDSIFIWRLGNTCF